MKIRTVELPVLYFGSPVALLSTLNEDGSTNLTPISSYWILGQTCVLGLGTASQGYLNLCRHADLVINLPDGAMWRQVEAMAPTTGMPEVPAFKQAMGYACEREKFGRAGLSRMQSDLMPLDRVRECPVQLEARVEKMREIGPPDSGMVAVEVTILRTHVHEALLDESQQRIRLSAWQPLYYAFRHYFSLGAYLGRSFRAG